MHTQIKHPPSHILSVSTQRTVLEVPLLRIPATAFAIDGFSATFSIRIAQLDEPCQKGVLSTTHTQRHTLNDNE
jgi:hypothetical protein